MFEPLILGDEMLEEAGVYDRDARMICSLYVKSHALLLDGETGAPDMLSVFTLLYEPIDLDDTRQVECDCEIEGVADESATLARLRSAVCESYENAREELFPAGVASAAIADG